MKLSAPIIDYNDNAGTLFFDIQNPNTVGTLHLIVTLTDGDTGTVLETTNIQTSDLRYGFSINTKKFFDVLNISVDISASVTYVDVPYEITKVCQLTESTKNSSYRPVNTLQEDMKIIYLKAFCNMPEKNFKDVYCCWERSIDGITWEAAPIADGVLDPSVETIPCNVIDPTYNSDGSINKDATVYSDRYVYALKPVSSMDNINTRPDVYRIYVEPTETLKTYLYRFRMLTCAEVPEKGNTENLSLGLITFTPVMSTRPEYLYSDIHNASKSNSLYYNRVLYGFGNPQFKNNLIASHIGESVRPLSRMTPLNTFESSSINALVPWKDYIVAFTETSSHLITRTVDGFVTNTLNTFIGITSADKDCCKSILNGVIFKSGPKIYMLYPNMYAGSDSVLNLTELSKPIEDYIIEYDNTSEDLPFAITSDAAYLLFMPTKDSTICVKYDYTFKRWSLFEYPIVAKSYTRLSTSRIKLVGSYEHRGATNYAEYYFDVDTNEIYPSMCNTFPYMDYVHPSSLGVSADLQMWQTALSEEALRPIKYTVDTGQKADTVGNTRQFVETKIVASTKHERDNFPIDVLVYIEGNPFITKTLIPSTDGAFVKKIPEHTGVLATNFNSVNHDIIDTYRQMFIRYSGKGKSIRHILEGNSLYAFKLYNIDCRYKYINTKQ